MKIFNFSRKENIIHDVIISLVVFILVEALKKLIQSLPSTGTNILRYVSNSICQSASTRIGISLFDIFCVIIVLPLLFVFILVCSISFFNWNSENKEIKSLKNAQDSSDSTNKELNKLVKKNRYKMASNLLAVFIGIFCLIQLAIICFFPAALRHSFDVELKRIAPYTTVETIQKLESEWTRMKTEKDLSECRVFAGTQI